MQKNALAFALWFGFGASAMAFEPLAENEMSNTVAQDGVTVLWKMDDNGVRINTLALVDKNGIADNPPIVSGYNNAGRLMATNTGFKTCAESTINGSCTSLFMPTLRFEWDAIGDHNGNGISSPMLNLAITLGGGANKIRFYLDKIALSNSAGSNQVNIMDFGGRTGLDIDASGDYIDIVPIGSKTLLNLQFGFQGQGHMVKFVNGNFGTIDFGTVSFVDATTPTNSVRFGFKIDEFNITNSGIDIGEDGLEYRSANFGNGSMDITFSDIKMGGASAASMGTIGLQNISITNLVVTVAGKS